MSTRRGRDVEAQALAESARDLRKEAKAVLTDEQAHRRGEANVSWSGRYSS
jgi:hypothetical protein